MGNELTNEGPAQAIREIERLVMAACKTTTFTVADERRGTYYLVGPDGKATLTEVGPGRDNFQLDTPAELLAYIKANYGVADQPAVFLHPDRVVYVPDQSDRRDRATCELVTSAAYNWLAAASQSPSMIRQADFVRLLRITFRGCLPNDNLMTLIRQLKFTAGSEAVGNLQHGRESMGKSITAAVTGESAIPEEVGLSIQVFENHPGRMFVTCALEIMPQEGAFRLTPYPLEVRRAMDDALESIRELLTGDDLPPCYRGRPEAGKAATDQDDDTPF